MKRVAALAAILRLALALDRTHQQNVQGVRAQVSEECVEIIVDASGDADVDLWAAQSKVELFEEVFGREVVFTTSDSAAQRGNEGSTEPVEPIEAAANRTRPR